MPRGIRIIIVVRNNHTFRSTKLLTFTLSAYSFPPTYSVSTRDPYGNAAAAEAAAAAAASAEDPLATIALSLGK